MSRSKKSKLEGFCLFTGEKMWYTIYNKWNGGGAMSVDRLQEKIRKEKNALIVSLPADPGALPPEFREGEGPLARTDAYCRELMETLKGTVPGVRLSLSAFSLMGPEGLTALTGLLKAAAGFGYYTLLDAPLLLSQEDAGLCAEAFWGGESRYPCDGTVVSAYPGSDVLRPFLPGCKTGKKDLFALVRGANRSAAALQDLLTGSRVVHTAAADLVSRLGDDVIGRSGYSRVGLAASAGSGDSLRSLRQKYPRQFLLVDGLDYPWGNGKNVSYAFDRLGHGAAVSIGVSVTAAWRQAEEGADPFEAAAAAAQRINKNLLRYITIL